MTAGLVNSVVHAPTLAPAGPTIQAPLFPDDTARTIADLERRLVDSEAAYATLCDEYAALEAANRRLLAELHALRIGLEVARRVNAVCTMGRVRR